MFEKIGQRRTLKLTPDFAAGAFGKVHFEPLLGRYIGDETTTTDYMFRRGTLRRRSASVSLDKGKYLRTRRSDGEQRGPLFQFVQSIPEYEYVEQSRTIGRSMKI